MDVAFSKTNFDCLEVCTSFWKEVRGGERMRPLVCSHNHLEDSVVVKQVQCVAATWLGVMLDPWRWLL
jgi:hypothetical protein